MPDDTEIDESSEVATENEFDGKEDVDDETMAENTVKREGPNGSSGREVKKPKLDPKDPLRPRRKKARRACYACQRAHLTCGMFHPSCLLNSRSLVILCSLKNLQSRIYIKHGQSHDSGSN